MILDCLTGLVGISPTDPVCWTGTKPEGANDSTSGYFAINDDFGAAILKKMAVAGWEIAERARGAAIKSFSSDLSATLLGQYDPTMASVAAMVGKRKSGQLAISMSAFVGLKLSPVFCRGAKFVLQKVWLGMGSDGYFDMFIKSTNPDFEAVEFAALAEADKWKETVLAEAVEIPFWTPDGFAPDYYLMRKEQGIRYISQSIECCGSTPEWKAHFRVNGVEGSTDFPTSATPVNNSFGIVMGGYLVCDFMRWLCDAPALGGYDTMDVVARTIQFRTGANIIQELLGLGIAGGAGAFSAPEQLARMNWLNTRYSENVAWLGENIPAKKVTDCLSCKESDRPRRVKLFV